MHPKTVCLVLSILCVAGALGMALSFLHLALSGMGPAVEDAVAGGCGLVAGAILFGAGLISSTLLYQRGPAKHGEESVATFLRRSGPED